MKDPILSFCRWFADNILNGSFNEYAKQNLPIFLFFDEVQNLTDWAPQIKALVDHHAVRVFLTGSSALRIEYGRDSLAGRISTLELGTLLLREIAALRGWEQVAPFWGNNNLNSLKDQDFWKNLREYGKHNQEIRDRAFAAFSERGGYPVAQARFDSHWQEVASHLNETVIRRVIRHDLRLGDRGRKRDQNLLEQMFQLCCRYTGQAPKNTILVHELQSALSVNIGWQRVLNYLKFLHETLLIRLIPPLELRLKRSKGQPKITLCDHALRASWLQENIPLTKDDIARFPHLSDLAGHLAESIIGYFLGSIPDLDIAWFPERATEPEVDFVINIGEHRIPIEIKYRQHIDSHRDTLNLRSFLEKSVYNAPFGILITLADDVVVSDPRIVALSLPSILLMK